MAILCASCGFDNPPGMRFCGNCGTRLEAGSAPVAPPVQPADANPFGAEFGTMIGADLAERLRRAGVEATGQRRNVTVLFADMSGFTSLSQRIDGEDLYNMVQSYVKVLSANVYKYEGVVDKITGDGIMALYGAPISHENNAERAVRSALDMQSDLYQLRKELKAQMGEELSVRIGLHSGSVIVGGIGSNLLMNYTAIGDTVNLAHRIEEAAPPDAILVSEAVYRQVRAFIDCQQISVLHAKGIAHPVVAYRVVGVKTRPGSVRGVEGLYAPMIGRDQELAQLKQASTDLLENGRGQFAIVTGEAGLGKSRLTAEFKASLDVRVLTLLEGQSLAYRRVSYWLIREVLYCYLGLPSTTPPFQVRERLSRMVYQRMGLHAEEALAYIEHLMALPYSDPAVADRLKRMEPGQLRQQIFLSVRDLLLIETQVRPLMLVLDDLHWADDASLELLHFLMDALRTHPIYILAIARQVLPGSSLERSVTWARQNLGERFISLPLHTLSPDQSKQLLNLLLSIPDLPEKLHDQIVSRAAGVPFYLEEILRMLIDQGIIRQDDNGWQVVPGADVANLGVPDTLQELILARFDRLLPPHRRIMQVASVIGKDFSVPVLGAVLRPIEMPDLHAALDLLQEREFIQSQAQAMETEYTFRHILMSDAIYSTMLRKDRSAMHGQVAETIERIYADRIEDQIELLANHYRWSPFPERALHYAILAGQRAARNQVTQQASQHYETALELMGQVQASPYQACQVHTGLGDAQMFFGEYPEARQYFQKALEDLFSDTSSQYVEDRSGLYRKLARTYERQGDYDQAMSHLAQAQDVLDSAPGLFPVERAQVWNDLAWLHLRRDNLAETENLLQKALVLAKASDAFDVLASIYNRLGGVAFHQGDWDRATGYLRQSIEIREATRDLVNLATSLNNLGLLELEMGRLDSALENMTRSYELKTRLGQPEGIAIALVNLGWLRTLRGELPLARLDLKKARDLTEQIGYTSLMGLMLKNMVELHLMAEDWDQAIATLDEYRAILEAGAPNGILADCYRLLGEAYLGKGEVESALAWIKNAGDILDDAGNEKKYGISTERGDYLRLRGMVATHLGDWQAAARCLQESRTIFQQLRSTLNEARVIYRLGQLEALQGNQAAALTHLQAAAETFEHIGARLDAQRAVQALRG